MTKVPTIPCTFAFFHLKNNLKNKKITWEEKIEEKMSSYKTLSRVEKVQARPAFWNLLVPVLLNSRLWPNLLVFVLTCRPPMFLYHHVNFHQLSTNHFESEESFILLLNAVIGSEKEILQLRGVIHINRFIQSWPREEGGVLNKV